MKISMTIVFSPFCPEHVAITDLLVSNLVDTGLQIGKREESPPRAMCAARGRRLGVQADRENYHD
jgi:hypothetical protein